ncbi:MAG: hypothetical protein AB1576_14325 [Bacillota bacterium]
MTLAQSCLGKYSVRRKALEGAYSAVVRKAKGIVELAKRAICAWFGPSPKSAITAATFSWSTGARSPRITRTSWRSRLISPGPKKP